MSKELAFTDDNDVVKYLDTTTAFNLALTADGVAFDLTNAKSILAKIANDDGYIMQQTIDLTTVSNLLGGTLIFPINQDIMNTLVPDDYDIEVWVTMNDGTQAIFPSDGTLGFSIEDNLMSDTGEVIPTITLNDFQQQFNDLSNQMENAVHNVQKGDQGNPGNGIKSANNQYQLGDSPVTVPTGSWSDTILATTDQLPYLWTKIIFSYDDGTTKETNFVSSRGDTGSQGPIGPVGPQGEQGNGLVVRGKADKEENLPTTGNNQGDGYLVGTDLYIWIDGSWQNMGSITPDLADYVKVADMNNALETKANTEDVNQQLDKKVTDNKDGSIIVNGKTFVPADNSTVVHTTDMRKSPSDVAGIKEVDAKQDVIGYTPADDSKVAHLSGANNFDTVPTVNNNPLLLASSLPSDIARTGQDTNFTGKLQKSGQDVAIDSQVVHRNPDTGAVSDSVNFTAGLQSGGVSVATSDDLKSVEASAWRELDLSGTSGLYKGKINIKIDDANKTIYLQAAMYFPNGTSASQGTKLLDLSHVVNSLTSAHGYLFFINGVNEHATMVGDGSSVDYTASTLGASNSSITINSDVQYYFGNANYILPFPDQGKSTIYVTYDSLKD